MVDDSLATQRSWGISSNQIQHRKSQCHIPIPLTGGRLVFIRFFLPRCIIRPTYSQTAVPFLCTAGNYRPIGKLISNIKSPNMLIFSRYSSILFGNLLHLMIATRIEPLKRFWYNHHLCTKAKILLLSRDALMHIAWMDVLIAHVISSFPFIARMWQWIVYKCFEFY